MVTFFETEDSITNQTLDKIEKEFNIKLPFDYKKHLLKHNGGRCEPNIFSFVENGKKTESRINWFLAIYDGEYDNFVSFYRDYKIEEKRLPDSIIPIASDPFGNLICIDSIDNKIYFWDHELEIDYSTFNDNIRTNLYIIGDNLFHFISNLRNSI